MLEILAENWWFALVVVIISANLVIRARKRSRRPNVFRSRTVQAAFGTPDSRSERGLEKLDDQFVVVAFPRSRARRMTLAWLSVVGGLVLVPALILLPDKLDNSPGIIAFWTFGVGYMMYNLNLIGRLTITVSGRSIRIRSSTDGRRTGESNFDVTDVSSFGLIANRDGNALEVRFGDARPFVLYEEPRYRPLLSYLQRVRNLYTT